jgi:aryl-phospho-beta-D-glucosidase BglC (GH1 family)
MNLHVVLLLSFSKELQKNMGIESPLTMTSVSSSFIVLIKGKLLPQEKLDLLMADHFATFITDYDLEELKSAKINTIRIPVSYNVFIPEPDRTDKFPHQEREALDRYPTSETF